MEAVLETKTVTELIEEVVILLNQQHGMGLAQSPNAYRLLMASKTGKRKDDYPSLEPSQDITLTGIRNFYLDHPRQPPKSRSILTSIGQPRQKEKKVREAGFCFCLFGGK